MLFGGAAALPLCLFRTCTARLPGAHPLAACPAACTPSPHACPLRARGQARSACESPRLMLPRASSPLAPDGMHACISDAQADKQALHALPPCIHPAGPACIHPAGQACTRRDAYSVDATSGVCKDGWMDGWSSSSAAGMPCYPHNCEHASSMPGVHDGQEQATPKRSKNGSTRGI